jgi:hypothetical protein
MTRLEKLRLTLDIKKLQARYLEMRQIWSFGGEWYLGEKITHTKLANEALDIVVLMAQRNNWDISKKRRMYAMLVAGLLYYLPF